MITASRRIEDVRDKLYKRGIQLNRPFEGDPSELAKAAGITLDRTISDMYRSFDGFPEGVVDGSSCIRIWPLNEVLTAGVDSARLAFADFMMSSQDIVFDASDACQPIAYGDTGERLAANFHEFIEGLASGKFDFQ